MTAPLLTLLAHAERERNAAMSEAKRVEIERRNAARQLDQLETYRRDYEQRWSEHFSRAEGIAIVQCYQGFMDRLALAIAAQRRVVQLAAQRLEQAQARWQQHELRVASVRKLIARRDADARGEDARREQKQQDEFAARTLWQLRANALSPA